MNRDGDDGAKIYRDGEAIKVMTILKTETRVGSSLGMRGMGELRERNEQEISFKLIYDGNRTTGRLGLGPHGSLHVKWSRRALSRPSDSVVCNTRVGGIQSLARCYSDEACLWQMGEGGLHLKPLFVMPKQQLFLASR